MNGQLNPGPSSIYYGDTSQHHQPHQHTTQHLQQQHQHAMCDGTAWSHPEYRALRDKFDATLEQLAVANAKLAAMSSLAGQGVVGTAYNPGAPSSSSKLTRPHGRLSHSGHASLVTLPPPEVVQSYRQALEGWERPGNFSPTQLLLVPNFSASLAASTGLQSHIPNLSGEAPSAQEWKGICKDRKQVVAALLDTQQTWTAQDEGLVDLAAEWLEMKYERLALCELDGRWKATAIIKARFEEARKPITKGTTVRPRDDSDGGAKKRKLEHDVVVDPSLPQ
ncbi:hypothetical protein MNV49_000106 [Pseudohyphozyma bogoriensis]|nr:hypothetical protein MNV49_000106 [Pseudohyphozyma bogoriensis]